MFQALGVSLSLADEHDSLCTKWIMHDPNKSKMISVNMCLNWKTQYKRILYQKILRWQWNLAGKFLKNRKGWLMFNFWAVSGHALGNHNFQKPKQLSIALHPVLAIINDEFIGRSIKCYSMKHLQKYPGEPFCLIKYPLFTTVGCTWCNFR